MTHELIKGNPRTLMYAGCNANSHVQYTGCNENSHIQYASCNEDSHVRNSTLRKNIYQAGFEGKCILVHAHL